MWRATRPRGPANVDDEAGLLCACAESPSCDLSATFGWVAKPPRCRHNSRVRHDWVLGLLLCWPALARAEEPTKEREVVECSSSSEKAHMLGLQADWGTSSAYGLVYGHDWVSGEQCGGLGALVHARLGGSATLATHDHSRIDAYLLGPVARFGIAGDGGIFEYEVQPSVALGDDPLRGVLSLGVFIGYRYFALGYAYAFSMHPRDRPEWLASHRFALRVALPLHSYDREETHWEEPRTR